jgi:hypothetical protein
VVAVRQITEVVVDVLQFALELKPKICLPPVAVAEVVMMRNAAALVVEPPVKMQLFVPQMVNMEKVEHKLQVVLVDIR